MNMETTIKYLGYKREDDLRTMQGKGKESKAARKGMIYLREFHREISRKDHTGILIDSGYDLDAINNAFFFLEKEEEEKKEEIEKKEARKCKQ